MSHSPIFLKSIALSFPQKVCFSEFSTTIHAHSRIAIVGRNGSGKSCLLRILHGHMEPSEGSLQIPDDVVMAAVPQVIEDHDTLSGGERLNEALTQALGLNPNLLVLDEPTNHLDYRNRRSLMRLLQKFPGTVIVASHDVELLKTCIDTIWHIDNGTIHVFSGVYDDYVREISRKRESIEDELARLDRQKKDVHQAMMKEQERAKKSNRRGEQSIQERKWPTITAGTKARRAQETTGDKKRAISDRKSDLMDKLAELRLPEVIIPKFALEATDASTRTLVHITEGSVGYLTPILGHIHLSLRSGERLAITGDNGSGKTTMLRAIRGDPQVAKGGDWIVPKPQDIGYLDQHYGTLDRDSTPLETIRVLRPDWSSAEIRRHLNDFLFRKTEEVIARITTLSGGEKARLSLAQIAAKPPKLLILDEVTNNLDLETRAHVIQVLRDFPGSMIVASHDEDFLKAIGVVDRFELASLT